MEQGDCGPESKFGPMQRGDVFKRFVPCAPIKFGSSGLLLQVAAGTGTGTGNGLSLNVESIIVRGIQLIELPNPPDDVLQLEPSTARRSCSEGEWLFRVHHRPPLPWNASAVTTVGRVTATDQSCMIQAPGGLLPMRTILQRACATAQEEDCYWGRSRCKCDSDHEADVPGPGIPGRPPTV